MHTISFVLCFLLRRKNQTAVFPERSTAREKVLCVCVYVRKGNEKVKALGGRSMNHLEWLQSIPLAASAAGLDKTSMCQNS